MFTSSGIAESIIRYNTKHMPNIKNRLLIFGLLLLMTIYFVVKWPNRATAYNYGTGLYGTCVYGGQLNDTALSFSVNTSSVNLTATSITSTGTGTATFTATQQCSDLGYIVTVNGTAPTNGSHTLTNLASATASSVGTEQYGINLVANSTPSVGANASGGSGTAAAGYNTANLFKYVSGDTIASTATYSAQTTYTISFIVNASKTTPGGLYSGTQTLICTATY